MAAASDEPIPRTILGLYDDRVFPDERVTVIHRHAEMPLQYLGLKVRYRSVQEPLPKNEDLKGVRGILTWFTTRDAVANPASYCLWLSRQMERGLKVAILGYPGVFSDNGHRMVPECRDLFRHLGVDYQGQYSDNPFYFDFLEKEEAVVEFERKLLLSEGLTYSLYRPVSDEIHIYLKAVRRDLSESESALVFSSPKGGFVHPTYVTYHEKSLGKIQWRLNPFHFFEEVFNTQGLPRPDVTTVNGRRVFFSHVDGDGIFNVSHLDQKSWSGEILLQQILSRYSSIPITVSLITGYFDLREFQDERVERLITNIYRLPHVEPAAHGYAHPEKWREKKLSLRIGGYRFDARLETLGAVDLMDRFLKKKGIQKKTTLFLWTGDATPEEETIRALDEAGIMNLNGGESRNDRRFDSYAFVYPVGIDWGRAIQIYAPEPNENVYTNLWHGPYYGYREVIETFRNTENPLRVKPMGIYYHFYSAERVASLAVLKGVYDDALAQPIFPMTATGYARMARDFFRTDIYPLPHGFRVEHPGELKTVRFDREERGVDIGKSRGVLGFRREKGSLYVFLSKGMRHDIVLTSSRAIGPYLEEASFFIENLSGDVTSFSFTKNGWHRSEAVFAGLKSKARYRITTGTETLLVRSDAGGRIKLVFGEAENGGAPTKAEVNLESF